MIPISQKLVVCLLACCFAASCVANNLVYVDVEDVSWTDGDRDDRWYLEDNDTVFQMPFAGYNYDAWISSTMYNEGSYGLGMKILQNTPTNDRDRMEFCIVDNQDSYTLHFGETRYVGFAMYIHPQHQTPNGWCYFMQVWQAHDTSNPKHPPLALKWKTNDGTKWRLVKEDDSDNGTEEVIYTSSTDLTKGVWHEFILKLVPSYNGDGTGGGVTLWLNGDEVINESFDWGYDPTVSGMEDRFDIRVGIYRYRQNTKQILVFDQLKYGTTYSSADP